MHVTHRFFHLLVCFSLVFFTNLTLTSAQTMNGRLALGVNGGLTAFNGDVTKREFVPSLRNPSEVRWGGGLNLTGVLNPYLSLRYNWFHGSLRGVRVKDNNEFSAVFNDHSLQLLLNVNAVLFKRPEDAWITAYGIVGYGLNSFRSIRRKNPGGVVVESFGYNSAGKKSGAPTKELSIPVGLSLRTRLDRFVKDYETFMASERIEIMLDVMVHFVNSDKMDAFTGTQGNDRFAYISLGAAFYFF